MSSSWYEVVQGASLAQGDIILACPVYRVENVEARDIEIEVAEEIHDVAVLTQSCDLENNKVDDVLLAHVLGYRELVAQEGRSNPFLRSSGYRKSAIKGNLPAQSLLPERLEEPRLPWSLVDFHHLFTVPKSILSEFADRSGPRLRLLPPYREHLAQALARYFMRVGLPTALNDFEKVTP